jgi:hypothetical protein
MIAVDPTEARRCPLWQGVFLFIFPFFILLDVYNFDVSASSCIVSL